jgi:Holliday junction resolvase-like predicted endonuclease
VSSLETAERCVSIKTYGAVMDRDSPRRQGDLGELSAMEWLGSQGYVVFYPIGHSPDIDLIADDGRALQRVQVKTTTQWRNSRWEVTLCTRGGNRSWSGLVKHFSGSRCDSLFVLVADGRRWFVPAGAVTAGSKIVLGGPKYAMYEVEPGRPLASERT